MADGVGMKVEKRWLALGRALAAWRRDPVPAAPRADETPLRAELFSAERLEQHGRDLAATHLQFGAMLVRPSRHGRDPLLRRLADNQRVLAETCSVLITSVQARQRIVPAGEWLLDNFYLIEAQIRTTRQHLPRGYSRELPRLSQGPAAGLPRVYALALEVIAHGDGRIDEDTLGRFVLAYQSVSELTLGELWAIPIMLRLALIENLRRVGARVAAARLHVIEAGTWAERMLEVAATDPKNLVLVIADMARSNPPMVSAFVAELARRLQGQGAALALPLNWIEQRLAENSQTIEQLVLSENQQQAADQISISNSIGSQRFIGAHDWRDFVESMSLVERLLRSEAGDCYRLMDFATRDRYRHVIDSLAKHSGQTEAEVTRAALVLTAEAVAAGIGGAQGHVGHYLIGDGRVALERLVAARVPRLERWRRASERSPLLLHIGVISLMSLCFVLVLMELVRDQDMAAWQLCSLALLAALAGSQLATTLANWWVTLLLTPELLPRLDFSRGLPPGRRCLVVVPCLLGNSAQIEQLLEGLEVRFLGNQDPQLHFALLSDFRDAAMAELETDGPLLQQASAGIIALNRKYRDPDRFFLLHRPRRFNAAECVWMGYERKRGKLAELNALLRGEGAQRFALIVGAQSLLPEVQYVITLDTDTLLPRDCAVQLVGTLAHPLNAPVYDPQRQRVVSGYGILQPRMAATLSGENRSWYARLCGAEPGIDPYTRSVSDVYQDLFAEGSFIGKGIYEVDAFEAALKARFPENRILSHDLLEGCHARSGLISDVHLYEEYPAQYLSDVGRHRRWIRGDWQIAQWLWPRVPGPQQALRNPLSALSRWKIFDNLRRSLVPPALSLLLLLGWFSLPYPWCWTLAAFSIVLLPPLLGGMLDSLRVPGELHLRLHLRAVLQAGARNLMLATFRIACLPFEAWYCLDAIVRTLWRMGVSGRGLLEWQVANGGAVSRTGLAALLHSYRIMWIAPLTALLVAAALWSQRPDALPAAAPVLVLWLLAPGLASWLSRPLSAHQPRLSSEQTRFLHRSARATWSYFEQFVTAAEHHLPPDNFQEDPGPRLAHRTSPTNIGLALLANLTAADFGYIPAGSLLRRTEDCFQTLARLPRHLGHFYNWYDTRTLLPLAPRYVSAVDSGNLAGHLLTLRIGLLNLPQQAVISPNLRQGLLDTLALLLHHSPPAQRAAVLELKDLLRMQLLSVPQPDLKDIRNALVLIAADAAQLEVDPVLDHFGYWCGALQQQCAQMLLEIDWLLPWLVLALPAAAEPDLWSATSLSLQTLAGLAETRRAGLQTRLDLASDPGERTWLAGLLHAVGIASARAVARIERATALAEQTVALAAMDFEFLYDRSRHLLAIGYNVDEFRRDTSFYDLLASEARQCCFVGIAQGQLPQQSWFALGRTLTSAGGEPILVSWSGSMFEYLMPLLVMPAYAGSLLEQTCRAAVARQISFGQQLGLPWGVSESGYYTFDASLNYQYHAFGVPGLGLKRGLADDLVVAPYASALALMVAPEAACANLQRLAASGLEGRHGFYEAVDYTPARLSRGQTSMIVRSWMAHHQGMSLLALSHLLLDRPMQRRFEADPQFQATLLLLQERIPKNSIFQTRIAEHAAGAAYAGAEETAVQAPIAADTPRPEVQLLSNGRYQVMISNAGGGYSRWKEFGLTRWREDGTCDHWGAFVYLRDPVSGEYWSATHQPTLRRADSYEAMFSEGRAEFRRRDHQFECHTEIVVSPEDDIELRRLRISNRAQVRRTLEITSYAEVVLATPAADQMQSAFSKLFVQTEVLEGRRAILCTRRPRSLEELTPCLFHLVATSTESLQSVSYETDRMRFIGRDRTLVAPRVLCEPGALSGTAGSVLDPIVAIRCVVVLEAGQSLVLDLVTGAAEHREACLALIDKYQDRHRADRVIDLAWTHAGVTLRQLNATEADAQLYRRLAGSVLHANAALRAEPAVLLGNRRGQSGLWGYAISGDLPIVLLKIADSEHIELARQLIQAHAYWRLKGLVVDLVIWNEDHVGYRQRLQDQIINLISTGIEAHAIDRPGGIFVRSAEQISAEDRILLQAVARIILVDSRGSLLEQLQRREVAYRKVARLNPTRSHRREPVASPDPPRPELILANPLGGFSADGREYQISTSQTHKTPLPWVNVIANPHFGTVITESGMAYSWSENAHEFRLTPWSDDPVGASGGEALYLRDEETGHLWSPTPLPRAGAMPYRCRHGFGYSVFEHTSGGIHSELWVYVDVQESIKFSVLRVRNGSGRMRQLSATAYVEWVLGDLRARTGMHVVTEIDPGSGALLAHNGYNTEFAGRVAFFDVDDPARTLCGDRREFLGRNGSLGNPAALKRQHLSGRVGAALDPCGALQVPFELADGQTRELIFRLGAGHGPVQTRKLIQRFRKPGAARHALDQVHRHWRHLLGAVQVQTPDPALNVLTNGWLVYQTLACRLWARSGYSQSGGAFGFRDQLQDTMALLHATPELAREHLLRCAARQYPQGDVQHWWHPPAGRGVRTRCSDDYLWLPLATCRYVQGSGDHAVLDEQLPFLEGRALAADEESYYDLPGVSSETASLYQHCVRAISHSLRFGERGLPLMGSGDWNDGMNLVGIHGRGESVWLGFFLYHVLQQFAGLARQHADPAFADHCETEAARLRVNLELHAWDGAWYRRAWFDDGTPLGSAGNAECAIDSIAQSWSVLSTAADPERARLAMAALDRHLVKREDGLVQLLQPPFDQAPMNPGYIKGYLPGVRENGGQYTHAAVWAAMAFARLGDGARAWELLDLINPVKHALSAAALAVYKTEPYALAADVYAVAPHTGRGGWTWYTGSAGWLYRLIVESLLGLRREGARLFLEPCLPSGWPECRLDYRFGESSYRIVLRQTVVPGTKGAPQLHLDGQVVAQSWITLVDDHRTHEVELQIELAAADTTV